jgi:hypothetical protein
MFDGSQRTIPARLKVTNLVEVRLTRFSPTSRAPLRQLSASKTINSGAKCPQAWMRDRPSLQCASMFRETAITLR